MSADKYMDPNRPPAERLGTGPMQHSLYERLNEVSSGVSITKIDEIYAPIEGIADPEEAKHWAEEMLPGLSRTMRRLRSGPSEARSHAGYRVGKGDVEQIRKENTKMRRAAGRLRQMSRATIDWSEEDF